jgi:hypothetical protein
MKFQVIEQTANHLILQTQPAGILGFVIIVKSIIFGLSLLIGIGVTVGAFTTGTKTLTCERVEPSQINCEIKINESSETSESSNQIPVTNLQEARVYPNISNNSNEVVLLTKVENVIFSKNINHASVINKFVINKEQKYLTLSDVNYLSSNFFEVFFTGLISASIGMGGLLWMGYVSLAFIRYKFDKVQQILTLEKPMFTLIKIKQLTLVKHKKYEYPYSGVLGFYFETEKDSDGDTYYQIRLKLKEDKELFSVRADKNGKLLYDETIIPLVMEYGIKGIFNLPNSKET